MRRARRLVSILLSPATPKGAQIRGADLAYFFYIKSHGLSRSATFIARPKSDPQMEALLADVGPILGHFRALRTGDTLGLQRGPLLPGMLAELRPGGL